MAAAVLRAEPPRGPSPAPPAEIPAESRAAPEASDAEGAREPPLKQRQAPAACAAPSAPPPAGPLPGPAPAPAPAPPGPGPGPGPGEEECPICTEPYDGHGHKPTPLNCGHVLCGGCVRAIMDTAGAAEIGRVRCPLCRQKTPMLEWEICRLQEELLLLHAQPAPAPPLAPPGPPALPPRRPGLLGALEHRFQVRFRTSRVFGCLPCVRYPPCLLRGLGGLERRCRCCYLLALALLLAAETLSLLLVFLPVVLLVLLFLILNT
ncbi:ring finger protein-like [Carettochelys insculpta]|uniref:ring finger protein-like n=1 Tax=Carettochelys insculpta TaxID=44489 RepID=UPI003EBF95A5